MSPNLLYIIGTLIVLAIVLKSVISASVWLSIPSAWYLTLEQDTRIAITVIILAGIYSQIMALVKYGRNNQRLPRG